MFTNTKIAVAALLIAALTAPAFADTVKKQQAPAWTASPPGGIFIYDNVIAFDRERSSH